MASKDFFKSFYSFWNIGTIISRKWLRNVFSVLHAICFFKSYTKHHCVIRHVNQCKCDQSLEWITTSDSAGCNLVTLILCGRVINMMMSVNRSIKYYRVPSEHIFKILEKFWNESFENESFKFSRNSFKKCFLCTTCIVMHVTALNLRSCNICFYLFTFICFNTNCPKKSKIRTILSNCLFRY